MPCPIAVPCVRLGDKTPALPTDRSYSLESLNLPQAALLSLPLWKPPGPSISVRKKIGNDEFRTFLGILKGGVQIVFRLVKRSCHFPL